MKLDTNLRIATAKRFQCQADKGYLILGGDPYSWVAMAEWLVQRDAKNIIVVHKAANFSSILKYKLDQLKVSNKKQELLLEIIRNKKI